MYYYYRKWVEAEVFDRIWDKLRSKAVGMLMRVLRYSYHNIRVILADGGYCGNVIKEVKEKFGYWLQAVLREESNSSNFKPMHKRWIAERTFSCFDKDR
ncbi:hypothetical protein [Parafilimonas sp.]|uniref:hypothetical protein n=1 Tax=Parafilimonas sp. TaxID=1969739 RepID=UPI0039E65195